MLIGTYKFANPEFFWLLILVPFLVFWYIRKYRKQMPVLKISSLKPFENQGSSWKKYARHAAFVFRMAAVILIIIALARPQKTFEKENITREGINIVIALDISPSMDARDFIPNRIGAAKKIAQEFIENRKNDRIGLVVFSGESFTQCPITTDHTILNNLISEVRIGMLEDGTAIGLGLATAVDRLRSSPGKSRVIILLTDGVNNINEPVTPLQAAAIAKQFNVRVYTVGIGKEGIAPIPVHDQYGNVQIQDMPVEIDEPLLKQIAAETGGNYYRATNNSSLREIYQTIDRLEKARTEVSTYRRFTDKYRFLAWFAGLFLLAEFIMRNTFLRYLP